MTLVSIIVPIYKTRITYFEQCINSILGQTYQNIEVIIVDDGADEELVSSAEYFGRIDSRIKIVHQDNQGAAAARNHGLRVCQGEYVTFVDSDDWIDSENIESALYRIQNDNLQVLLWGSYKCYIDHRDEYMPYKENIELFSEERKNELMFKTMVGHLSFYKEPATKYGSGSCCSKMYEVQFLRDYDLSYPEGIKRAEDVNFNIRVFDKASRIGYLNRHYYYYRQHDDSATFQYRPNGIEVFTDALKCLESFIKETGKDDSFWQIYYMRCMFFFLESMDMDYLNPQNKTFVLTRIGEMKRISRTEPYRTAFERLQYNRLSMAKRIPLFLIKRRWMGLLCIFYKVYRTIM